MNLKNKPAGPLQRTDRNPNVICTLRLTRVNGTRQVCDLDRARTLMANLSQLLQEGAESRDDRVTVMAAETAALAIREISFLCRAASAQRGSHERA